MNHLPSVHHSQGEVAEDEELVRRCLFGSVCSDQPIPSQPQPVTSSAVCHARLPPLPLRVDKGKRGDNYRLVIPKNKTEANVDDVTKEL